MAHQRPSAMDWWRGWQRRLRALVHRQTTEREMQDELAFHIDMATEQNIRAGLDPAEARRKARLEFGGVDRFAEEVSDVRNIGWLEDFVQDLRHAARSFRRAPGFTAASLAALSLGIGANIAVFPVVYAVLIAPLPYAEPERILRVWESNSAERIESAAVSPGTFTDLRERSATLERLAMFGERNMLVTDGSDAWEARAAAVSPELFELLGMQPIIGRTFAPDNVMSDADAEVPAVVISHRMWQRQYGGATDVVGRTLRLEYRWSYTIVGVMPPGFAFPSDVDIWTPLTYKAPISPTGRQFRYYGAIAKLSPGSTIDQARTETSAIATQLAAEYPASNAGWTVHLEALDASIVGKTKPTLLVLSGLAGCVLLIACGNVATLALARATQRRHETAVRIALGAGTRRLLRQWTAEGLLLALFGGLGGLVVGYWSSRLLIVIAPDDIPRLDEVVFGRAVLMFAGVATLVSAAMISLAPVLRSRRSGVLDAMRSRTGSAGSASAPAREWLLGSQVALTFVLVVATALLLRSFERLQSTDLGFRRHDVLSVELRVPGGRFPGADPWIERLHYYDRLLVDLRQLPGVRSVAGTTNIPLNGEFGSGSMWRTDAPGAHGRTPPTSAANQWRAAIHVVTPGYFETLGIPVVRGRTFDEGDRFTTEKLARESEPKPAGVIVINEAMAKRYWPGADPIGSTLFLFDDHVFAAYRTVVGVVRDVRAESVAEATIPTVFLPFGQHPGRGLSLVLRADLAPSQMVGTVMSRLKAFDPEVVVADVRPLDAVVGVALSRPRFTLLLVGSFALLAISIAFVGVFGIVGFLVTRRTQEIGIRMALGAHASRVLWLVLREGLRPVLLGVLVGGGAAVAVARSMQALLYGIAPLDGVSFVSAAALILFASIVAAALPAGRATGVDPLRALRAE